MRDDLGHFIGFVECPEKHLVDFISQGMQEVTGLEVLSQGGFRDFKTFQGDLHVKPLGSDPLNLLHTLLFDLMLLKASLRSGQSLKPVTVTRHAFHNFDGLGADARRDLPTGDICVIALVPLAFENKSDYIVDFLYCLVDRMILHVFLGCSLNVINLYLTFIRVGWFGFLLFSWCLLE